MSPHRPQLISKPATEELPSVDLSPHRTGLRGVSWWISLRVFQIKLAVRVVRGFTRWSLGRSALALCGRTAPGRNLLHAVLGYHRSFSTLCEAEKAVRPYANRGHLNPLNIDLHLALNRSARPSDYSALFHIAAVQKDLKRVFDLGGNVGNLFYCYRKYIRFLDEMVWTVYDVPTVTAKGAALADERSADALRFTNDLMEADDADLLIASGSLHYFDGLLPRLLASLPRRPRAILINRTPLTDRGPIAVVQEAGSYRVACLLQNRDDLIRSLAAFGYDLTDAWQVPELRLHVPARPGHDIECYAGLYFRLGPSAGATSGNVSSAIDGSCAVEERGVAPVELA